MHHASSVLSMNSLVYYLQTCSSADDGQEDFAPQVKTRAGIAYMASCHVEGGTREGRT